MPFRPAPIMPIATTAKIIFHYSSFISNKLGKTEMNVITRLMGLILAVVAIGMSAENRKKQHPKITGRCFFKSGNQYREHAFQTGADTFIFFHYSSFISNKLGKTEMNVITRLMGLILAVVGFSMCRK
jgi:small neutral amino acid transporter SnatA (MarC family)